MQENKYTMLWVAIEVNGYHTKIIKNIGTFKTLQYFLNNCFFEIQVLKLKNTLTGYDPILFIANSCFILIKPYYTLVDLGILFTLKWFCCWKLEWWILEEALRNVPKRTATKNVKTHLSLKSRKKIKLLYKRDFPRNVVKNILYFPASWVQKSS